MSLEGLRRKLKIKALLKQDRTMRVGLQLSQELQFTVITKEDTLELRDLKRHPQLTPKTVYIVGPVKSITSNQLNRKTNSTSYQVTHME